MQNSQKDFFISYNSADRRWGEWIGWQLEKAGFTVVIQAWDFRPGQDFLQGMQEAMEAKQTIAVLSEDYLKADFTRPEWSAALVQDPRGNQRTLIPVLVRPCTLKGFFATRIHIDLTNVEKKEARQKLLDGIRERAKPDTEPPFPNEVASLTGKSKNGAASVSELSSLPFAEPPYPKDMPPVTKTVEIFTVFSKEDEKDLKMIEKHLETFKKQGLITTWNSGEILPGYEIDPEIEAHWNRSRLILLLISADAIAESKTYQMIERAKARQRAGTARVIPILLRPCISDFDETFTTLPTKNEFVTDWKGNRDAAFLDVAKGIRKVVDKLLLPD